MLLKVLHLLGKEVWAGVFAVVVVGVFYGIPYLKRRRAMKAFDARQKLSGTGDVFDSTREGEWQGKRYSFKYVEATKHAPARLNISLNAPSYVEVAAFRLNWWLKFCLKVGIGPVLKSGHPMLDELWYFSTGTDHHLKTVIASPREAEWIELSQLGADVVAVGPEGVSVRLSPFEFKSSDDLQIVFSVLPHLEKIATGRSTYIKQPKWQAPIDSLFRFRLGVLYFVLAFIAFMTAGALIDNGGGPVSQWESSMLAAKVFGFIAASFLFGILLFRRAPKMALLVPWLSVVLLMGIPAALMGVDLVNGVFDSSPVAVREVLVVSKKKVGKKGREKAIVQSWRAGNKTEEIFVPPIYFANIVPGETMLKIHTRAGALGLERVTKVEDPF